MHVVLGGLEMNCAFFDTLSMFLAASVVTTQVEPPAGSNLLCDAVFILQRLRNHSHHENNHDHNLEQGVRLWFSSSVALWWP